MGGFLLRRLLDLPVTMLLASLLIFLLMHLAPGDPIENALGALAQPETVQALRTEYGLDRPLAIQYLDWLVHVVQGDLGKSLLTREPVTELLLSRVPATAVLTLSSAFLFLIVSFPLGILAAARKNSLFDRLVLFLTTIGIGLPNFFLAVLLIALFGVYLRWLPIASYVSPFEDPMAGIKHFILPTLTLTTFYIALTTRLVRASVSEALAEDYVRTARAMGLRECRVLFRHAARNGLIPATTAAAINGAYLLGGSIIVEEIFAIPGLGRLLFTAVVNRDFPVIQGIALFASVTFVVSGLIADVLVAYLDPRIKLE